MGIYDYIQLFAFLFILLVCTPLLGTYMYKVLTGKDLFYFFILKKAEKTIYKIIGINPSESMNWKNYTFNLLLFNFLGFFLLFIILLLQNILPLNPQKIEGMNWHTAFNTSISFMTNTNWQSYSGESMASYFSQMVGLGVQNFLSAATGIATLVALTRGIKGKTINEIGNFWVDVTRSILYILLPLSIILALLLISQGVIQNFNSYIHIITLEGDSQIIPQGPAASQIAIKQLGTNGGGFFGTNSAHPFENPTPFSNFLQMISILLIPMALTFTYGKMINSTRQGWALFSAMFILFVVGLTLLLYSENMSTDLWGETNKMEGKEVRFGVTNSVIWSTATTAASNGSVNAMLDSLTPLAGMVAIINIMIGEVVFGGVGAGLYGVLIFVILTVFIAGLMVGRTPEYLGKKIEAFEVKMAIIAVLLPSFVILLFTAIACSTQEGLSSLNNAGPHGFSEILYAFSSAAGNNGSAFGGLNVSTPFYNIMTGLGMLIGRFGVIIPILAIAGSLAKKKIIPISQGTFRTDNFLFVGLLIAIILIIGGLTFFPALSFGPAVEHILMLKGVLF